MKVTEKGQVTIPIRIREKLRIRPGDEVEFVDEDGSVVLVRSTGVPTLSQRIRERAKGAATTGLSTDEIMALTRGE